MSSVISYISQRYSKTSNKCVKSYDSCNKPYKHIIYEDGNSLYRYEMSKCLPAGGFKLIDIEELFKL